MEIASINGWTIFAHEFFAETFNDLVKNVEALSQRRPYDFKNSKDAKLLNALLRVIEDIATDPTQPKFRQGNTLGTSQRHWFRAKFCAQYRLFFRYDLSTKTIILVWLNDDDTKRAYGSKRDAYKIFTQMLKSGNPPSDWETLFEVCRKPAIVEHLHPSPAFLSMVYLPVHRDK